MRRQRGELVSVAEALAGLPGPVQAFREASPQARHHFTLADQVNQLVSASEADPDLGFMARLMTLCSLPRTNPGHRKEYKRVNGPYTLYLTAIGDNKLPYGNLPRLLLAWVSTEAVRTQSREIVLGRSLSKFMRTLGIGSDSGGSRGELTRLRNQMKRLFRCSISLNYEDERGDASVSSFIADRTAFWWKERKPDEPMLWESRIYLGEVFFNEIISHPVPLDMNTLTALKRCALGLDLYLWLTYRTFTLRAPLRLTHTEMPSLPRRIKRAGDGAVTMPGKTPQPQLGWYRLRRITRRQTRVSISTTWASSVPGNGSRGRPQRGHFCCSWGSSATSSRASSPSRLLRPWPRLPGCCPRGRDETGRRDGLLPSLTRHSLRRL